MTTRTTLRAYYLVLLLRTTYVLEHNLDTSLGACVEPAVDFHASERIGKYDVKRGQKYTASVEQSLMFVLHWGCVKLRA